MSKVGNSVNFIEEKDEIDINVSSHSSMPNLVDDSSDLEFDEKVNDEIRADSLASHNDIILQQRCFRGHSCFVQANKNGINELDTRSTTHQTGPNRDGTFTDDSNLHGSGESSDGSLSNSDIWHLLNVLDKEKVANINDNYDSDVESVISESSEPIFNRFKIINHISDEMNEVKINSNIKFEVKGVGLGKTYVGGASRYPPRLDKSCTLGAFDIDSHKYTNVSIENDRIDYQVLADRPILDIGENPAPEGQSIFVGETNTEIINDNGKKVCVIHAINNLELVKDEVEHELVGDEIVIKSRTDKWHVHVPVRDQKGNVKWIYLFADPGANVGCVKSSWAWNNYPDYVRHNTRKASGINTPGGFISPKFVLWMTFPAISGKILKVRMYLVDELPVDILADINMLRAFGYSFKDETPPFFKHPAEEDIDLELKEPDEQFKIHNVTDFERYQQSKQSFQDKPVVSMAQVDMHSTLIGGDILLYSSEGKRDNLFSETPLLATAQGTSAITDGEIQFYHQRLIDIEKAELELQLEVQDLISNRDFHNCNLELIKTKGIIDPRNIKKGEKEVIQAEDESFAVNVINEKLGYINKSLMETSDVNIVSSELRRDLIDPKIDHFGNSVKNAPVWHRCMLINAKQSFLADQNEIADAVASHVNEELKFNNYEYLKDYPKKYGMRFTGLYEGIIELVERYRHVFATHQFSRKTMNVPPARLGIRPEFRGKTMFAAQYPINAEKRKSMINYTIENEKNGFWHSIDYSLHCVPYTMVPKRRHGVIYRYRPAFDGRVVNQYCELMEANMPTLKDIDDLHSIPGFVTCADVKNCFDCIPLDRRDWAYAVCMTPLGLYQMRCLTYGWMNAAPEAQKIMNNLALAVGNTLAYIDDIAIKHPLEGNAKDICDSVERLLKYCDEKDIQLHPGKFFPACTESEGFSFVRTLEGSRVGEPYTKKVLALAKPNTVKELQEYIGVLGYIGRFIYHKALFTYWLNDLIANAGGKGKIVWTKQAELAYQQLNYLVANSPLLYNPTKEGEFCLKTDACNYGVGAVLYQLQKDPNTDEERWVIVDMWSKTMPVQLRHCHSMVHEAYALVHAMEHWQFYLLKRKFKLSTDNNPVANIFAHKYRDINPITQRQLLRLRNKVTMFTFDSHHVKGIDNELADSLSRFTSELLKRQDGRVIEPWISRDTNNKPLTEDDIKAMDSYLKQSEDLRIKHKHLSMDKSFHTVSNLLCTDTDTKFHSITNSRTANWINLLHDYHNHANYLEAPRLKDYLNSADEECIQDDEFDDPTFAQLREHVLNIAQNVAQLPQSSIKNIACTVQQFRTNDIQHIFRAKQEYVHQLALIHHNLLPVEQDDVSPKDVYNPEQDLGNLPPTERVAYRTPGVVTRSMAKRKIKEAKLAKLKEDYPDSNDPLVKKQEKELMEGVYDHLNAEYNRSRFREKTRDEFLYDIFGHRNGLDIFKLDNFKVYQETDAAISAVKKLIHSKTFDISSDEFDYLFRYDPDLLAKAETRLLKVNKHGILQVKHKVSEKDGSLWLNVVPFSIRGKMMDYAHHNLQLHHFEHNQTYDQLKRKYWWGTMKTDVRNFCETCISCQFIKGSVRHRAPLRIRELPQPRSHIFADFLGSIYNKYYILVLVDYATGYTMLIPTTNTDAQTIVNAIIDNWVKIFGWFNIFESDWGQGFNSKILEALTRAAKIKLELAEPRNHRSIGKVERTIGFVQSILNQYNTLLDQKLIATQSDSIARAWEIITIIMPFVQLAINQHRSRFTAISPNMLMLGSNVRDASELGDLCAELKKTRVNVDINDDDYKYVEDLFTRIQSLNDIFKDDWKKYCRVSRETYNKRWSITPKKVGRFKKRFKIGSKVLYFIGDKQTAQKKWRVKWTGPWIVKKHLNDSTAIITDPESGNDKRVTFDRIKIYRERDVGYYDEYFDDDDMYQMHYNRQKELLYKHQVKVRQKDVNLDYSRPEILKETENKENEN